MLRGTFVAGFLSHWNPWHYSPLLVLIKIIIVKFLLKITTLKIQSDRFGIKCSWKHPTDCSLQQALHIYYHTWRWDVMKDTKFQPSLVDKKVIKNVGTSGYFWVLLSLYNIEDFILLAWGPHLGDFIIIQKIVKLLWVTEYFVMRRLSATMILNVSMWKLRS